MIWVLIETIVGLRSSGILGMAMPVRATVIGDTGSASFQGVTT